MEKKILPFKATNPHFRLKNSTKNKLCCRDQSWNLTFWPLKVISKEYIYTIVGERTDCNYFKVVGRSWSFYHSPSSSGHIHFNARIVSAKESRLARNRRYTWGGSGRLFFHQAKSSTFTGRGFQLQANPLGGFLHTRKSFWNFNNLQRCPLLPSIGEKTSARAV